MWVNSIRQVIYVETIRKIIEERERLGYESFYRDDMYRWVREAISQTDPSFMDGYAEHYLKGEVTAAIQEHFPGYYRYSRHNAYYMKRTEVVAR